MEHPCHDETEVARLQEMWHEIAATSLDVWDKRDQQEPFLSDNRRGYARVTPVGLTSTGVPDQMVPPADQYPLHGLGFCAENESTLQFTTYVWSSWTSKAVQPMHVDQSIQDLLNRPARGEANTGGGQSKSCDQQTASSDSSNKRSVRFPTQATTQR